MIMPNKGKKRIRRKRWASMIISKRIYSFAEISKTLGIHIRTVQAWHVNGLPTIDEGKRPFLVKGIVLKNFLLRQTSSLKYHLRTGEIYCLKCRTGRRPLPASIYKEGTERKIGKSGTQVILHGICEICGTAMRRFSTSKAEIVNADTVEGGGMNGKCNPISKHLLTTVKTNIRRTSEQ